MLRPLYAAAVITIHVHSSKTGDGWECAVTVRGGTETHHRVHVSAGTLERLAPGATDPDELVRSSFAFLLDREPQSSILREFELPVICTYFPEYETAIRARPGD